MNGDTDLDPEPTGSNDDDDVTDAVTDIVSPSTDLKTEVDRDEEKEASGLFVTVDDGISSVT